jgi:N-acetylmuramoyl-L-alanine amidase
MRVPAVRRPGARLRRLLPAAGLALVAGCGSTAVPAAAPSSPVAAPPPGTGTPAVGTPSAATPSAGTPGPATSRATPPPTTSPVAATATPAGTGPTATRSAPAAPTRRPLVVVDPGHNGGNIEHLAQVTRLVDAGHGQRKPCNEIGAETAAGYGEHAFTWDVAVRLRALLAARGVDVRLTRSGDRGFGPCVDVRGRFGNALKADAVVSVHADGGPSGGTGFHVIQASRPAGDKAASSRLALALRASMLAGSGLRYATYVAGGNGLDVRDDLAGLTLSSRPSVMVEAGNMANRSDAALQSSAAGRQRVAAAVAAGILAFLGRS